MIVINFANVAWGTDPNPAGGVNINVKDQESGIVATVPFDEAAGAKLAEEILRNLSPDAQRQVITTVTAQGNGIVLPNDQQIRDVGQ